MILLSFVNIKVQTGKVVYLLKTTTLLKVTMTCFCHGIRRILELRILSVCPHVGQM